MESKQKVAMVFGTIPNCWEIDQFKSVTNIYDFDVISVESVCGYISKVSRFDNLTCKSLPDFDDNPTYMPGLEKVLEGYDVVIVKERLGLFCYQAVKAKLKHRFKLIVWTDNLASFAGDDIERMRTVRDEITSVADGFIVQSHAARTVLNFEGVPDTKIKYLHPFVEKVEEGQFAGQEDALKALNLSKDDFIICHVGQLEWEESLLELIHGIKLFKDKYPTIGESVKLVMCGIGTLADTIAARIDYCGLTDQIKVLPPTRAAYEALAKTGHLMFFGSIPSRDRIEGDPYRLMYAIMNDMPVLACRGSIVEEYIGKHRIDFCTSSPMSIADALKKATGARSLLKNIAKKNKSLLGDNADEKKLSTDLINILQEFIAKEAKFDEDSIENQLLSIEELIKAKQYMEAIDSIENLMKIEAMPAHLLSELMRMIGDCFTKLGDFVAGKGSYEKAIELNAQNHKAVIGTGTICLTANEFDKAMVTFQKAISLCPNDEMAFLGLGLAFKGLNENEEANKWILKSLDIEADNTAALYTLVQIATTSQQYDSCIEGINKYLAVKPDDLNIKFTLAGIYFGLDQVKEARQLCDEILAADPHEERSLELLKKIDEMVIEKNRQPVNS